MVPDNSGRYWICLDRDTLRVVCRQRMKTAGDGPTVREQSEGLWFRCGKKLWQSVRSGDVMRVEDLPGEVVERLVTRHRTNNGGSGT